MPGVAERAQAGDEVQPVERGKPWLTRRKVAVGVASFGAGVAGVSILLGINARDLHEQALARCPDAMCAPGETPGAQAMNDRARARARYATVGYGVAGVAIVTSVVLWITGNRAGATSPPTTAVAPVFGTFTGITVTRGF